MFFLMLKETRFVRERTSAEAFKLPIDLQTIVMHCLTRIKLVSNSQMAVEQIPFEVSPWAQIAFESQVAVMRNFDVFVELFKFVEVPRTFRAAELTSFVLMNCLHVVPDAFKSGKELLAQHALKLLTMNVRNMRLDVRLQSRFVHNSRSTSITFVFRPRLLL